MPRNKTAFFDAVARHEANSAFLAGYDIYFRVEDRDDIRFWEQVLSPHIRGRKYKFLPYVERGGHRITGKCYIMNSLSQANPNYILCVDSDFDYLLGNKKLDVRNYVLQTYTYSPENHYCWASSLQRKWSEFNADCPVSFNFECFLQQFNAVVYQSLLFRLYSKRNRNRQLRLTLNRLCKVVNQIQPIKHEMLADNGAVIIHKLNQKMQEYRENIEIDEDAMSHFEEDMETKGLTQATVYLYMQGHAVYNLISRIGNSLYGPSFESQILSQTFDLTSNYSELNKVKQDASVAIHAR